MGRPAHRSTAPILVIDFLFNAELSAVAASGPMTLHGYTVVEVDHKAAPRPHLPHFGGLQSIWDTMIMWATGIVYWVLV
jgi:hypothetical protein